jgi:hypothetical protein
MTILEVLENSDYNLQKSRLDIQIRLGIEQLHNALLLINDGAVITDEFNEDRLKEIIKSLKNK